MIPTDQGGRDLKTFLTIVVIMLIIPLTVQAQGISWQTMNGPYYVYNVTGLSIGYTGFGQPGQQTHAYAVGSDLSQIYVYNYHGDSPIGSWQGRSGVAGVKYVNASRYDGLRGYAAVPENNGGTPGVNFTVDGQTWRYTDSQPANKYFTAIETHPANGDICFTASEFVTNQSTIARTTDGGTNWLGLANPSSSNCTAVHIDPNSGNGYSTTTVYSCFDQGGGIYKSTNGGNTWTSSYLDIYGDSQPYDGIDIAAKKIEEVNLRSVYAITRRQGINGPEYALWNSTDEGVTWNRNPYNFDGVFPDPSIAIFKITVDDMYIESNHLDLVYIIATNRIYWLVDGNTWWTVIFDLDWNTPKDIASDIAYPETYGQGAVYIAQKYGIHVRCFNCFPYAAGDWYGDKASGTNIQDVISLDCFSSDELMTLSKKGGYIFSYPMVNGGDWGWVSQHCALSFMPSGGDQTTFQGTDISLYYDRYDFHYVASAQNGSTPYLIDNGYLIDYVNQNPSLFNAVKGTYYRAAGYETPLVGGTNQNGDNAVWTWYGNPPYLVSLYNFGSAPPEIHDLLMERISLSKYYVCGRRQSDIGQDIVAVLDVNDINYNLSLSQNLAGVLNANSIVKSKEIEEDTENNQLSTLYLGTDNGIFKNKFNLTTPTAWYSANAGINSGIKISKITNYYHIIQNDPSFHPDSIVQYAMGHDISNNPYIYVSADSGRSWNEFGGYFRDRNIALNDLATFSSHLFGDDSLYLAVGTDNGVYRYPLNVKSGVLTISQTWGPGLYIINGDVTVPYGMTLTINAGTEVLFTYNFDRMQSGNNTTKSELIVYGTLNINGVVGNPVTLKSSKPSNPAAGDWYGIRAESGSSISLAYCIIKHADYGIYATDAGNVVVEHCLIDTNTKAGIYLMQPPSNTKIRYSRIQNSGAYGVYANLNSPEIKSDTIQFNSYGIYYLGNSSPSIKDCLITNQVGGGNSSYFGISVIRVSGGAEPAPTVLSDSIYGFGQGGIYFEGVSNQQFISDSRVVSCGPYGIKYKTSNAPINTNSTGFTLIYGNAIGLELANSSSPQVRRTKFWENSSRGAHAAAGCFADFGNTSTAGNNSFKKTNPSTGYRHLIYDGTHKYKCAL